MPGNGSTLPNSSPFPPVAMAACDLTEFLGDVPTFSEETKLINAVFLMPSLSAGAWSHQAGVRPCGGEGRWVHAAPRSHPSSVCPSPWGLTHPVPITVGLAHPVLPAAGSPQDAGSSGALPAPYRLRLSAAPSFAVLCVAHQARMERRDYRKKNRNERRPWLLFSHLCPLAVAVPAAGAGLEGGRLLEGAAVSPCRAPTAASGTAGAGRTAAAGHGTGPQPRVGDRSGDIPRSARSPGPGVGVLPRGA